MYYIIFKLKIWSLKVDFQALMMSLIFWDMTGLYKGHPSQGCMSGNKIFSRPSLALTNEHGVIHVQQIWGISGTK